MTDAREMCDGWDATAKTAAGNVVLHFRRQPTEGEIAAAVADYERAQTAVAASAASAKEAEAGSATAAAVLMATATAATAKQTKLAAEWQALTAKQRDAIAEQAPKLTAILEGKA